jgi:hypothetical protein
MGRNRRPTDAPGERVRRSQDPVALGATGSCHVRTESTRPVSIGLGDPVMLVNVDRRRRLAAVVLALGLAATGCASPTVTPPISPTDTSPSSAPATSTSPPGTPSPTPSPPTSPAAGLTETDWGTIRDALPPGFPRYPGSTPTETGGGAASAVFDVPADVPTVTTWLQDALERAGFSTLSLSGPGEDGSMEIESVGPTTQCRVRTTVARLGGSTIVTVLYGGSCPST